MCVSSILGSLFTRALILLLTSVDATFFDIDFFFAEFGITFTPIPDTSLGMGQRNLFYSVMAPFSWIFFSWIPLSFSFSLSFHFTIPIFFISSVLLLPHIWQHSSYPYWTTLVLEGTLRYLGFISCSFPPFPFLYEECFSHVIREKNTVRIAIPDTHRRWDWWNAVGWSPIQNIRSL